MCVAGKAHLGLGLGGGFKDFIFFNPIWGFMIQFDESNIFQMGGWFNHQLVTPPRNKALLRGYEAHHCPLDCHDFCLGKELCQATSKRLYKSNWKF